MKWLIRLGLFTSAALAQACFVPRGPGGFLVALAGTAIVTAAVVSAVAPPPPRVVYVPPPRVGYEWQPGYWSLENNRWVWIEGRWIVSQPGYRWLPAHCAQDPEGNWRLIPGQWIPLS